MISIFNLTLAANEAREVAITGEYFELRNALYPVALIELLDRSGGVISRLENPEQSDFVRPGRYETVRVTNGPTAQTIKHFYGTGDAGSRRTSGLVRIDGSSDVSVIDGEKARTLAGMAFSGVALAAVVAGQQPKVQLWNPAGSGVALVLKQILAGSGFANTVYVQGATVALATLLGVAPVNKLIGGAAGVAELRTANIAAAPSGNNIALLSVPATTVKEYQLTGPIVVPPGAGLVMWGSGVATDVYGTFEFFQQAYP